MVRSPIMIVILCNGVFDILHAGHLAHLKEARGMGDSLVVSLTLDANVNKGDGRPFNKWADRAALLGELRCVNLVIPARNSVEAILRVKPDIFVKGIDYEGGNRFTEDVAGACRQVGAQLRYTTAPKTSIARIMGVTV